MPASEISSTNVDAFAFRSVATHLLVLSFLELLDAWCVDDLMSYSRKNRKTADFTRFGIEELIFPYEEKFQFDSLYFEIAQESVIQGPTSWFFFLHF